DFRELPLPSSRLQGPRVPLLCRPSLPQHPPHAAEDVGRGYASAQVIGVPGDASAPAQAAEGRGDASAPGLKAFQGSGVRLVLVLASELRDEGFEDEPAPEPVPEGFEDELVLEPRDEGFEDGPEPVPEWFEKELILVLASEPRDEGSEEEVLPDPVSESHVGAASVSEGSPSTTAASKGSPGTMKAKPDSKPPEFHRVPGGSFTLLGRPPDRQFLLRQPPLSPRLCRPSLPTAQDSLFRLNFVPARGDILVARLNFVFWFLSDYLLDQLKALKYCEVHRK
ncbi:hypothetical protein GOODEAATRI_011802, partial [Goodea atripinnis]